MTARKYAFSIVWFMISLQIGAASSGVDLAACAQSLSSSGSRKPFWSAMKPPGTIARPYQIHVALLPKIVLRASNLLLATLAESSPGVAAEVMSALTPTFARSAATACASGVVLYGPWKAPAALSVIVKPSG